jgi:hypothetical protein
MVNATIPGNLIQGYHFVGLFFELNCFGLCFNFQCLSNYNEIDSTFDFIAAYCYINFIDIN